MFIDNDTRARRDERRQRPARDGCKRGCKQRASSRRTNDARQCAIGHRTLQQQVIRWVVEAEHAAVEF